MFPDRDIHPSKEQELAVPQKMDITCFSPLLDRNITLCQERVVALYEGIALGDALGLPVETFTPEQIQEQFGSVKDLLPPEHNTFIKDHKTYLGMISDDTQLSLAISRALKPSANGDIDTLVDRIAKEHIAALEQTDCGWGGSTREAVKRLAEGVHWSESGKSPIAKRGFGNGVPMKIAPLAVYALTQGLDREQATELITKVAGITHPTSMSVSAGLAQFAALIYCLTTTPEEFSTEKFLEQVIDYSRSGQDFYPETREGAKDDITERLETLHAQLKRPHLDVVKEFGGGGCYVYDSLPTTFLIFLHGPTSKDTLYQLVNAGGDTDSNASMGSALLGALNRPQIFDSELKQKLPCFQEVVQEASTLFTGLTSQ